MKVSVIIPTYNRADKLYNCLNSVINQTYKDIEIIVCDDGSTDNTMEIVNNFSGVKYIFMENSGGPAKPRNEGVKCATGDVIAFLDSDDEWYADKLTICTEAISSGFDFVHHEMDTYRDGKIIKTSRLNIETYTQNSLLKYGNPFMTSSVMLKTNIINDVGLFNESKNLVSFEDYDYWIRCLGVTQKVKKIYKPLGLYYYSKDSISQGSVSRRIQNIRTTYKTYSDICSGKMPNWMNYELAKCYAKVRKKREANVRFLRSIIKKYKILKSLRNLYQLHAKIP